MSLVRSIFTPVDHYRVTRDQPSTSSETTGLDFERCSALHNAIAKRGCISSGHSAEDFSATSWWEYWSTTAPGSLPRLGSGLHSSIWQFLKRVVPQSALRGDNSQHEQNLFYTVAGLSSPTTIFNLQDEVGEEGLITLYTGHDALSDTFHGIIYDTTTHKCFFNALEIYELRSHDRQICWQPLEAVLSTYMDMIERGKAVAFDHSVFYDAVLRNTDGRLVPLQDHWPPEDHDECDYTVQATRSDVYHFRPWGLVPFAKQDLMDALRAWDQLIGSISDRLPTPSGPTQTAHGLFSDEDLRSAGFREDGFAWHFFRQARKPSFSYLAPGLRLASKDDLLQNSFRTAQDGVNEHDRILVFPVPILIGESTAANWLGYPLGKPPSVQSGLYLDACDVEGSGSRCPFENGARLVLPYDLDGECCAHKADGSPATGNAEMFQLGSNPYMPDHPTQLHTILSKISELVVSGEWQTDSNGVAEPCGAFQGRCRRDVDARMPNSLVFSPSEGVW